MNFQEIYSVINKDNISARKAKKKWAINVTNDIKVRLTDSKKYGKTNDLDAMNIIKKVRGEYLEALEYIEDKDMSMEALAVSYCNEFLPKAITDANEVKEFVHQAIEYMEIDNLSIRDMGGIVSKVKELTSGAADGKLIASTVRAFIMEVA